MSPGAPNGRSRFHLVTDAVADGTPVDFDHEVGQASGRELRLIEMRKEKDSKSGGLFGLGKKRK